MTIKPTVVLSQQDIERLRRIAALIDVEAQCYAEGFGARKDGQWVWTDEWPEMHARYIKLNSAADYLRALATKHEKRANTSPNP